MIELLVSEASLEAGLVIALEQTEFCAVFFRHSSFLNVVTKLTCPHSDVVVNRS